MPNEERYLYEFGSFLLDPAERRLLRNGTPVSLPPKAFITLVLLVERGGRVRDKQELMRAVWPETFVEENNLTQCISILRKALAENGESQGFIETVPRVGYRFIAPVHRLLAENGTHGVEAIGHHSRIVIREEEEIEEEEVADVVTIPCAPEDGRQPASEARESGRTLAALLRGRRVWFGFGALCVIAAAAGYWWLRPPRTPELVNYVAITRNIPFAEPVAADGGIIYLVSSSQLTKLPVSGGGLTPITLNLPGSLKAIKDFSAARQEVLAIGGTPTTQTDEAELWALSVSSGTAWRIGDLYAHDANWSGDGQSILYTHRNGLYRAGRDGSGQRLLARLTGPVWAPRESPDGRWIRFTVREGSSDSIWEVAADGSRLRSLLTDEGILPYDGHWTPDSKYFIVPLHRSERVDLWALPRTNDILSQTRIEPIRLTSGPINMAFPVPSHDGSQIFAAGWLERVEILRHDAVANSFVPFLPGVSADGVAFSSDGKWVAYSSFPEQALWRSRVDGSESVQLSPESMQCLLPRWSPDGKMIAFMGHAKGEPWRIYLVPAQGGTPEPVVVSPDDQATPTWSPDGTALIYAGAPWMNGFAPSSTAVHYLDLLTRQVTTLPDSMGLWSPRWSPDGKHLVAETTDSQGLRVFDFRSRQWTPLVKLTGKTLGYTAWSHDSKYVYFNAFDEESSRVYRVNAEGEPHVTTVIDLKGLQPANTLGQWFTLAPDESVLITHDTSIRNIYALDVRFP